MAPRTLLALLTPLALGGCFHDGDDAGPAGGAVPVEPGLALQRVYPNLRFTRPVLALQSPGDASHWYVLEKDGRIWRFDASDPGTATTQLVLDITTTVDASGEGGLLGMAFHPGFAANGEVYLSYTVDEGGVRSRVSRVPSPDGGSTLRWLDRGEVLDLPQPYSNHNGGHIAFGADGYLYIGLGDGGGAGDPQRNGQDATTLLGAILRLNVDASMTYTIPADNPDIPPVGRTEIWAYGLRNPWRWSFDRADGRTLWAGDVGQGRLEEVDLIVPGGNYGWSCYEGSLPFSATDPACPPEGRLRSPVAEYGREEGRSVTGGYVYRGASLADLDGVYVFGDFVSGAVWGLFPSGASYQRRLIARSGLGISTFAQDAAGEIYVLDFFGGGMYRLVAAS